jgi:MtN3 and saliva related transmembrane protein
MTLQDTVGTLAATLTTIAFLPQAVLIWRTRATHGVSLGMYSIFTTGVVLWLIYGVMLQAWLTSLLRKIFTGWNSECSRFEQRQTGCDGKVEVHQRAARSTPE